MSKKTLAFLACTLCISLCPATLRAAETDWPQITSPETKAWTRWWWHGSQVTKADLTATMEQYAAAQIGGLEITPIYGVRGEEAQFIDYLTPQWMDMLEHVLREADRLGMEIDIATGNGWPFGGPWVEGDTACKNLVLQTYEVSDGKSLDQPVRYIQRPIVRAIGRRVDIADLKESIGENADLQGMALEQVLWEKPLPLVALVAHGDGAPLDLTNRVDAEGKLDWQAPTGNWTLYAVFQGWHGKMVERAGPGGEGNVIDHFSRDALAAYLKKFDDAFAGRDIKSLRGFFNDSYEVDDASGNSDFTPRMFDEFQRRRGYNLREHLPALFGKADADENARVLCDYRETISDLLLEEFTIPWREWSHKHGAIIRNQAHGSPANILDLYAASDVPETESTDRIQFISAASAAHVTGKKLVSAEAATWQNEHFLGTLAETKTWVDRYFLGGVNHICYHGTCYSPPAEPWPGRLFYASVELQPTNPSWAHFHALNEYVARCQSFLQAGSPDSDVLVYYPIHDEWAQRGRTTLAHFNGEARGSSARRLAEQLLAQGTLFDFVSDRQLQKVDVIDYLVAPEGPVHTRALMIPPCRTMPIESLRKIAKLASEHATIILPSDDWSPNVAGLGHLEERRAEARELIAKIRKGAGVKSPPSGTTQAQMVNGVISPETMTRQGLTFMRRRFDDGYAYFIANSADARFDGWASVRKAASAVLFDPMSGQKGLAELRNAPETQIRLQLEPGQTCIVRTHGQQVSGPKYPYVDSPGQPKPLDGSWKVTFVDGGPKLPDAVETSDLKSWTDFGGDDVKNFSGVGRYAIDFSKPSSDARAWTLDLGDVHESAEVRLNGELLGTLITAPYRVQIPADKLKASNSLEIKVANLMANRIADLDRRGVAWKKFYNVNFAARRSDNRGQGGVFSAAKWAPLPSGLLGPVTLTPVSLVLAADEGSNNESNSNGESAKRWRFDFGPGAAAEGYTQVNADATFGDAGYGFEDSAAIEGVDRGGDALTGDFCTSAKPFAFSVRLPEGNYRIKAIVGDPGKESTTNVHAEVRRLLAEKLHTAAGKPASFTAVVNVRTPLIAEAREVRLKGRERVEEWPNWDDKLTLTFSGDHASLAALEIERDDRCPTLFLIGDSTVSDQAKPPWNSWGQMLPRFFGPTIAVANHAESGESIRSALGERRFEKLYGLLKPGDWVAVQFGHNDMKSQAADALATYTSDLEAIVAAVRERGATPILITSMERKNGIDRNTLAGYPGAVRSVAAKLEAPLVDLHAMSQRLYRGMGNNLDAAFQDGTHHQDFGSYELARCVVEGLRRAAPKLAEHLSADAGSFDPEHPETPENWGQPTHAAAP